MPVTQEQDGNRDFVAYPGGSKKFDETGGDTGTGDIDDVTGDTGTETGDETGDDGTGTDTGTDTTTTQTDEDDPNPYVGPTPDAPPDGGGDTGGNIDLGYTVPGAGEGPGAYDESGADVEATPWDVTREQTVAGQLEDNYDRGSPFMDKARLEGERRHQASGGQNSLMAGKAGQLAAMDTAFKVSFADAQTYARSAEFNAAMKNQFGLAEQRFIHNSLLSEQNYQQAVELQTQMISGQLEGIAMEYKGKGMLMDKEFTQFFSRAKYEAQLHEYAEQNGYQRQVALQGIISRGNFLVQGFDSVMQYANNPNFTPEQSRAAAESGLAWMRETYDVNDSFWASVGSPSSGEADFTGGWEWWNFTGGG